MRDIYDAASEGNLAKVKAYPERNPAVASSQSMSAHEAVTRERVQEELTNAMAAKNDAQRANLCIALVGLGQPCRQHLMDIVLDKTLDHYTRRYALKIASGFRGGVLFKFIESNCITGKNKNELLRALGDDEESHSQLCLFVTGQEILSTPDFFERYVARVGK